jgi:hypothetical protein
MAARQDQGLQIALIILIFLFILSAVAAYIGWKSYGESEQRGAELRNQLEDKNKQATTTQSENEQLRTWTGFGPNDNFDSVKTTYEADMKRYGTAIADETRRFYKNVLEAVAKERDDTAGREADARNQIKDLTAKLEAKEGETDKQIAEFKQKNKQLEEDNASERNKFGQFRLQIENANKELMTSLDKQRTDFEAQIAERDGKIKAFETQVTGLQKDVRDLRTQIPTDNESFEIADGRISRVNQDGTVWINVGQADAIHRQVTFNVYDADEHDADRAVKKGSIEVTKISGDHMSEARITQDDPTNPILRGDNIYSPVWHRGKKLRFAITGTIDFNNDGISDLELARDLIELNGGAVDAYLDDNGKVQGPGMTAHTRYLILGDAPESAIRANMKEGWDEMYKKAHELGVETITLDQFLNRMGYTPQERAVKLGAGAAAVDFPARSGNAREVPDTETEPPPADGTQKFRPRKPYSTQKTPY